MTTTQQQNTAALAGNHGFSIISNEKLLQIYAAMLKSRMLAERLRLLVEQGKLDNLCRPQLGFEAASAGVTIDLLSEDTVIPSPGDIIVSFLHGEPLKEILTRATRSTPAAQLDQSIRAALDHKTAKNGKIAVVFSDGEDSFSEQVLEAASAQKLPILFVCRKSQLSEGIALDAGRIPILPVDGVDAVAVYRVATESITHARRGNGPTRIECIFEPSEAHNPILKMESYLDRKGLFSEELKLKTAAAFTRELDAAVAAAFQSANYPLHTR